MHKRRKLSEGIKKQIAGSQLWRCATCDNLLSAAFEVDHIIPLFKDGPNERSNLEAKCANCHAIKTQAENIERRAAEAEAASERRAAEAEADRVRSVALRREFERAVRDKHAKTSMLNQIRSGDGKTFTCSDCSEQYYRIFPHMCAIAQRRIREELDPPRLSKPLVNVCDTVPCDLFCRFRYERPGDVD